jgi:hypothetical protein
MDRRLVRIHDENAGSIGIRFQDRAGLAVADYKTFVLSGCLKAIHDGMERRPIARRLADAARDDEIFGSLGDGWVEAIHQQTEAGFLLPAFAGQGNAAWRADGLVGACGMDAGFGHEFWQSS